MNQKLIALGLEAAEPTIFEKWIDEDKLPNMKKLLEKGSYRRLASCTEVSSGATWASVNTGTNPAKHGMAFYHRQLKSGTYKIIKKYADDVKRPPFWNFLSEKQKKVMVLDIPETYPIQDPYQQMVVGWGAEGLNYHQSSYPKSLVKEIKEKFGAHPLEGWYQKRPASDQGWVDLGKKLVAATKQRNRIYEWLLEEKEWDLFFAGYAEPHWIGHFFWFLRDPNHPDHNEALAKQCGDVIFEVYQAVDEGLGLFLEKYSNADYMIFSNTGMGSNFSGLHLLPEILEKLNLGNQKKKSQKKDSKEVKASTPQVIKNVEQFLGPQNLENIRKLFPERLWDSVTRGILDLGNDFADCKVFEVPTDFTAALRFNLKGREPKGIVDEAEYDALFETIKKEMLLLENPDTGEKVVEEVIKVRDKYKGDNANDLPDVLIRWKGHNYIRRLCSPSIGEVESPLPDKRTGAHMKYGFLLSSGSAFHANGKLEVRDIVDIAPTILNYGSFTECVGKNPMNK